jgi:hypothetical protein
MSKGAKPGELAIEPLDLIFVVNLKAAECLGISLPSRCCIRRIVSFGK